MRMCMLIFGVGLFASAPAEAGKATEPVRVRVVDVGNGLRVVVRAPGGDSLLHNARDKGAYRLKVVRDLTPVGQPLDLFVLSHPDADHIGELADILAERTALSNMHPSDVHVPITKIITGARTAIEQAKRNGASYGT